MLHHVLSSSCVYTLTATMWSRIDRAKLIAHILGVVIASSAITIYSIWSYNVAESRSANEQWTSVPNKIRAITVRLLCNEIAILHSSFELRGGQLKFTISWMKVKVTIWYAMVMCVADDRRKAALAIVGFSSLTPS